MSAAISSKTGFAEWYAVRGGWVYYANDFLSAWLGCDLILGASFGVPIKRGAVKAIDVATPVGKVKEKKIKQEAVKRVEIEESVEGIEVGSKTKKRKTTKSRKQLVISEEPEGMDPFAVGKEVGHSLILKFRVRTKVEFFVFRVPVRSSAHGSS